jgi:hypothetical protein
MCVRVCVSVCARVCACLRASVCPSKLRVRSCVRVPCVCLCFVRFCERARVCVCVCVFALVRNYKCTRAHAKTKRPDMPVSACVCARARACALCVRAPVCATLSANIIDARSSQCGCAGVRAPLQPYRFVCMAERAVASSWPQACTRARSQANPTWTSLCECMCVCVCVRASMRACVDLCVGACACVCVCASRSACINPIRVGHGRGAHADRCPK